MSAEKSRQVVVTGMGIVSPIGIGVDTFWENLSSGQSGIRRAEMTSHLATPNSVAAEVLEFTSSTAKKQYLKKQRKSIKVMCREIQLGVASALLGIEQSNFEINDDNRDRIGVDFGANLMCTPPEVLSYPAVQCLNETDATKFEFDRWGGEGIPAMEPLWLLRYLPNMPGCHIGIAVDARGPNNSLTLDEVSGNVAMYEACSIIKRGRADAMIAGTTGTRINTVKAMHAMLWDEVAQADTAPETWCRPFEKNRNGQVVGEGACSLILEEEGHARARGATIYGRVLSASSSCVANENGPDLKQAATNAMQIALERAGLKPEDIGHINAHGLADRAADQAEAAAIIDVFGDYGREVPVVAYKSYLGNSGSGCGLLELAGSLLGLQHGNVPPTLNYEEADPECPLNVAKASWNPEKKTVLSLNFTRAGQSSAVIIDAAT